ncbi:hypothetical protein WA158_005790 [Blastocystis sp. Blastoise]
MANVLVIGGGGRENAIAWKLSQSEQVSHVFVAPGNGGTASLNKVSNVPISESKHDEIIAFCKENNIKLVAVGPEIPLCAGLGDKLVGNDILCFGPCQQAAEIEGSKAFSKNLMKKYDIPTAKYETFTDYNKAIEYLKSCDYKVVIKASGLAAGKGVLLPEKNEEIEALNEIMLDKEFGDAGCEVVIEERLEGEECSLLCFTDGTSIAVMPPAQDHKRIFDHDMGPNTGGMGAYCPAPCLTPAEIDDIKDIVLTKCIEGLKKEGSVYQGVLYAGLMLTPTGIKVLEYNCRFGDPETQVILSLLDSDLYTIMKACCEGNLKDIKISWKPSSAVTVVCASKGYPGKYEKGKVIEGVESVSSNSDMIVFHSGTKKDTEGHLLTSGGRVLCVTGVANNIEAAVKKAYEGVSKISFEGMQYRHDIAHRALERLASQKKEITKRSYARVGLVGNPSDGFFGKTLALTIKNFYAEVHIIESDTLKLTPHPLNDPMEFDGLDHLYANSMKEGYYGGMRLLMASCKRFYEYCSNHNIPLHEKKFTMSYDTNIPRQVGLAGSSAIVTAVLKALLAFYDVTEEQFPKYDQPNWCLEVETEELGITAGLQDRVVQIYEGLVYMNFDRELMEKDNHGYYKNLDAKLLPPLFLAYVDQPKDSGKVHSEVKHRWLNGDKEIDAAMREFAQYTDDAVVALNNHDNEEVKHIFSKNFQLRRKVFGDKVIKPEYIHMVEIASQHSGAAKFPGSGGAIVGTCSEEKMEEMKQAYEKDGFSFIRISPYYNEI